MRRRGSKACGPSPTCFPVKTACGIYGKPGRSPCGACVAHVVGARLHVAGVRAVQRDVLVGVRLVVVQAAHRLADAAPALGVLAQHVSQLDDRIRTNDTSLSDGLRDTLAKFRVTP